MEEIWKDVIGYEGRYKISNYGRLKSIKKQEKILKGSINKDGYIQYSLNWAKYKKFNVFGAQQLVAMAFLNHKPCGLKLVVDHINDNKLDNIAENLQIVTNRFNTCKTQGKYSSQYKGVSWNKRLNKWTAQIHINGKDKYLGRYQCELKAHQAYLNEIKNLEQTQPF